MAKKIRARKPNPVTDSSIKSRKVENETDALIFSFKHLQLNHPKNKFDIKERNADYFCKVFERFKGISSQRATEIRQSGGKSLRAHSIDWKQTTEPDGFAHLNEQLRSLMPYQFQFSANEYGRVHGFFIDNVFYAIWLDPSHELYE